MKVKDIMNKNWTITNSKTTLLEASKIIMDRKVPALLVGDPERIIGFITTRDMITRGIAKEKDPKTVTLEEIMTPKCIYCLEDDSLEEASHKMSSNRIRHLVVLTKDMYLAGIIGEHDIKYKGQ
jgi:CBS domain-containing protein